MSIIIEPDTPNENFLKQAYIASLKSKDVEEREGAVIVDSLDRIVGTGYRGFPRHVETSDIGKHNRVFFEVPAAENAVYNAISGSLEGATLYVNYFPCHSCTHAIIQSKIGEIVFRSDRHIRKEKPYALAAKAMIDAAVEAGKLNIREYDGRNKLPAKAPLTWDEKHMFSAATAALRSKDPTTKVGACLVDADGREISLGYNGFPKGIDDEEFPWQDTEDLPEGATFDKTKHGYVVHSEKNAILNSSTNRLEGSRIYLTHFPDYKSMQTIIQSGISKVFYVHENRFVRTEEDTAAKRMATYLGEHTNFSVVQKDFDFSSFRLDMSHYD